jgi:hypothetical protein
MQQLSRKTSPIKMRNYGRIIQDMIEYACVLEDAEQREALVAYIAQCMRQKNQVWNKDQESGVARIAEDIERLSGGRIHYEVPQPRETMPAEQLQPQQAAPQPKTRRKKVTR